MTDAPSETLARTPLFAAIQSRNARMTDFAGWAMPIQFQGITQEHRAVRTAVGMFDVSHMGKFCLRGPDVLTHLQALVPSDLSRLQPGQGQYTVLLNEQAGILDDLIIYDQGVVNGDRQFTLIVNAATKDSDRAWITAHLTSPATQPTQLLDLTETHVLLAVQGPQSIPTLQPYVAEDLTTVPRFGHIQGTLLNQPAFLARTGYTGEDGFEMMVEAAVGVELWQALLTAGVTPCGLGARDTLRLEAAMALYGQDLDQTTTPLEAGLGWLVHWDKTVDFIGRSRLQQQRQQGVTRRLVGLVMQGRNIARHDYLVYHQEQPVGKITSGSWSPTLEQAIALAYVPSALSTIGQELTVEIRGKARPAKVVKRPFYRSAQMG